MDSSASDFEVYDVGCNYCCGFLERSKHVLQIDETERERNRIKIINQIKAKGKNNKYDCIVGISGGVDSAFALIKAKEEGLRPLAVHMDNGWNSELAQNNIHNIVEKLGVDLYTHVIKWSEYREMMQAFFDADVVDVELLYDNAMLGVNYNLAKKFGCKYILAGTNYATEGMLIPPDWNWFKFDKKNIKAITKNSGTDKSFPYFGVMDYVGCRFIRKINWVSFLDLYDYKKVETLELLTSKFGYKPYPYKHYESIFTRFYQGYILPEKFNVDKRRVHLSTLIMTDQMTRTAALDLIKHIPYPNERDLVDDKEYFLKKMNWDKEQLLEYISRPGRSHSEFPSEKTMMLKLQKIRKYFG